MNVIEKIMLSEEVFSKPPVLLDIGASEGIHSPWEKIAKYCIGITFDPDARDYSEKKLKRKFKKLYCFDCVVNPTPESSVIFNLTQSPYCSSLLKPNTEKLQEWAFAPLFNVEKVVNVKAKTLTQILKELNIDRVDWFKVDSQGTDLRLFESLGKDIYQKVLIAELEPGIIDAYNGEDKLYDVLKFMNENDFWLSDMLVKGSQRIKDEFLRDLFPNRFVRKLAMFSHKTSPGWAELLFINSFNEPSLFTLREYFLGWLFATLQQQHGFAYQLAIKASKKYSNPLLSELREHSKKVIKRTIVSKRLLPYIGRKAMQIINRIK